MSSDRTLRTTSEDIELADKLPNDAAEASESAPALAPEPDTAAAAAKMSSSNHHLSITNNPTISILAYCCSSILMTVVNKYAVSGTGWNLSFLLVAVQAIVCTIAITTGKAFGVIQFRDFNTDEARKWFPISLLLVAMLYTSIKALQFLSIPVYTIFKNLTIILIAYGEVLWFGGSVTGMALLSFGLMVLSSVVAAWADFSSAAAAGGKTDELATLNSGYIWMGINSLCSAGYLLGMRKRIKLTNFKDFDTMYYNNLLSIPVLLILSFVVEDWSSANLLANFPAGRQAPIIGAMVFTGLSSIFISYSSAWCVRVTSSTTYSMVGALNKLPLAISGLVFFSEHVTIGSVAAIFIGFVSGLVYTYAKILQGKDKEAKSSLPTTSSSTKSMQDSLKN